jgi:anti-sigma factor ChrR (cupin superfamily)
MNMMMLSCKKATELIEKKLSRQLSAGERVQLSVHTSMCKACSNYEKQQTVIDEQLKKQGTTTSETQDTSDLQQRILQQMKRKDD